VNRAAHTPAPRLSYAENERVRRICIRVVNHARGGADRCIRNRIFDLTDTLLRECHLRARPLDLAAMEAAPIEQMLPDLTLLRKHLNVGAGTLPSAVRLRFQQNQQEAA
jgi:hypothetical protein